jgi:predicted AAA+ superfamily ATPase
MLPLSFSEYRNALQPTANDNALFDRYLTYGGLLYVTQLTLDTIGLGDYQDIRHRNILDWLLEDTLSRLHNLRPRITRYEK